jgi:hypothetical protein
LLPEDLDVTRRVPVLWCVWGGESGVREGAGWVAVWWGRLSWGMVFGLLWVLGWLVACVSVWVKSRLVVA